VTDAWNYAKLGFRFGKKIRLLAMRGSALPDWKLLFREPLMCGSFGVYLRAETIRQSSEPDHSL
jgi:hypothetical protein